MCKKYFFTLGTPFNTHAVSFRCFTVNGGSHGSRAKSNLAGLGSHAGQTIRSSIQSFIEISVL